MYAGIHFCRSRVILWFLCLLGVAALTLLGSTAALSQTIAAPASQVTVPPGTILPVVLRSTISANQVRQGQQIEGRIAQDVPLADGSKIRVGSKVQGQIVDVTPATDRAHPMLAIRFDRLQWKGQMVPITTDLRAVAGFMEVKQAGIPEEGAVEGTPSNWWVTTQVGGDSVYGVEGPVMSAEDSSERVGNSVDGGVLAQARPKEGTKCRGAVDGNENPQALWVFSADACGTYGISNVKISHAGRTTPVGTIVLESQKNKDVVLRNGDALLLRVIG